MAADWPTVDDIKAYLRVGNDTSDDAVLASVQSAAVAWVATRVDQRFVPGSPTFAAPLPDPIYQAALMEAGRLYRRRDSVDGTIGWGDMGVVRVGPKDPDIETMLAPYLVVVFG